jgi:hypothetical protein
LVLAVCLVVSAAGLAAASPAMAQPNPPPCQPYTPVNGGGSCTQVSGPWVTASDSGTNIYTLSCPSNTRAVNASAEFSYAAYPLGIEVGGGLRPGVVTGFLFEVLADPVPFSVTFQPWVACLPLGTVDLPFRAQGGGSAQAFRIHVRTRRIHPRRHVRVRLGCRRGQRLVHSGSAVGFFTRRPPSQRMINAIRRRHHHHRTRSGTRTDVTAPAGVGDNERVELQVTTVCLP